MTTCTACEGRGQNTRGGVCPVCKGKDQGPPADVRQRVLWYVNDEFNRQAEYGYVPGVQDIKLAVVAALGPQRVYVAAHRASDGELRPFYGPHPVLAHVLANATPPGRLPAFVVAYDSTGPGRQAKPVPVAKWVGSDWVQKPHRKRSN